MTAIQYLFYNCQLQVISKMMNETSSGSFCSNDSVLQSLMVTLPFGGVGKWILWLLIFGLKVYLWRLLSYLNCEQVQVEQVPIMDTTALKHFPTRNPACLEVSGLSVSLISAIRHMKSATYLWWPGPVLCPREVKAGARSCESCVQPFDIWPELSAKLRYSFLQKVE